MNYIIYIACILITTLTLTLPLPGTAFAEDDSAKNQVEKPRKGDQCESLRIGEWYFARYSDPMGRDHLNFTSATLATMNGDTLSISTTSRGAHDFVMLTLRGDSFKDNIVDCYSGCTIAVKLGDRDTVEFPARKQGRDTVAIDDHQLIALIEEASKGEKLLVAIPRLYRSEKILTFTPHFSERDKRCRAAKWKMTK